ncbi:MAG TPA: hypothetical protein VGH33_23245, partial [Isosphaeraceae bacterium]
PAPVNRIAEYLAPSADPGPDAIPLDVRWIRITSGTNEGTYAVAAEPNGKREWERTDGSGRRLADVFANKAHRAGRVAILSKAPAAPVKPVAPARPARRGPSTEDMAYEAGRTAALEAGHGDVAPGVRLADAEVAAFFAGLAAGLAEVERDEDLAAAELQARWDSMVGDEDDGHEPADYVDARMALPRALANG